MTESCFHQRKGRVNRADNSCFSFRNSGSDYTAMPRSHVTAVFICVFVRACVCVCASEKKTGLVAFVSDGDIFVSEEDHVATAAQEGGSAFASRCFTFNIYRYFYRCIITRVMHQNTEMLENRT